MKRRKKKRILTVDDDPMTRELVKAILVSAGYEAVLAEDGLEAVEILEKQEDPETIACAIVDINMPRMDGIEFLSKLKSNVLTEDIPVIMLTAQSANSDIVQSYYKGASQYLLKPFTSACLLKGIEEVLNAR